mmetsp:Transcript_22555/g.20479  ORF Transcript_22555/g.20479 Transcript_22555/m.20479 type:complete len:241 (+) Transcript_22555:24-746(+)
MGTNSSKDYEQTKEKPLSNVTATLYYLPGRGIADPIRWLLAVGEITFEQKIISTRERFLKLSERQLVFGQLPMLQIDNIEIVQSYTIIRYIAKRANLIGDGPLDELKCDMIVEAVRELVSLAAVAPFHRANDKGSNHLQLMKEKWQSTGIRLENILKENNTGYLVGGRISYADVLVAHALTWYIEELGSAIVEQMPLLVNLQILIISLPSMQSFIKSNKYYPIGDENYTKQICTILGRQI